MDLRVKNLNCILDRIPDVLCCIAREKIEIPGSLLVLAADIFTNAGLLASCGYHITEQNKNKIFVTGFSLYYISVANQETVFRIYAQLLDIDRQIGWLSEKQLARTICRFAAFDVFMNFKVS